MVLDLVSTPQLKSANLLAPPFLYKMWLQFYKEKYIFDRVGEMAKWVKCLPRKHEELGSDPSTHIKAGVQHVPVIPNGVEAEAGSLGLVDKIN